jgi:hypothetical protein
VARALAGSFLAGVQAVCGLPVSARVVGVVRLVMVGELVTNVRTHAPDRAVPSSTSSVRHRSMSSSRPSGGPPTSSV